MTIYVTITATGRTSVTAGIRAHLGLTGSNLVIVEEKPDDVILRSASQTVGYAQGSARRYTNGNPETPVAAFPTKRVAENGD